MGWTMPLTLQATPETEPVDAAGRWPQSVAEFEDLVETVQDELVHFAFCRLRSLEDAEDTVQDILVRAYLEREKHRGVTGVRPYLFRLPFRYPPPTPKPTRGRLCSLLLSSIYQAV